MFSKYLLLSMIIAINLSMLIMFLIHTTTGISGFVPGFIVGMVVGIPFGLIAAILEERYD